MSACWREPLVAIACRLTLRCLPLAELPGPFPLANYGQTVKQPVYVGDVAQAIVASITDPAAPGTTYELVGPKQYTMAGLCEYVGNNS